MEYLSTEQLLCMRLSQCHFIQNFRKNLELCYKNIMFALHNNFERNYGICRQETGANSA